ncbi:hypothetical protein CBS101457_004323 [Exobasidium rhododendri]|nr:hypothetical protein CBS101457_004323 [Exobasidium rhododendri]
MGIRFIPQTDWFQLYKSYPSYIRLRRLRHISNGSDSVDTVAHPTNRNTKAALELARGIAAYLSARYSDLFQLDLGDGCLDAGPFGENVRGITRLECREMDLPQAHWTLLEVGEGGDDPMRVAGELVPDDLALLLPDDDAEPDERGFVQYRLISASICTAGFWRLKDKLNKTLQQIHLDGKVPEYATKLKDPMDRFFTKMQPGGIKLAERNNYFFQILTREDSLRKVYQLQDGTLIPDILGHEEDEKACLDDRTELTWGVSTNGPENVYDAQVKGPMKGVEMVELQPIQNPSNLVMRTERQTLRKLPKSGAVLFTIHTHMVPLVVMAEEAGVPGRLAEAMRNWPDGVSWYKAAKLYKDCVLPYLDEKHRQQLQRGIISSSPEEEEKRSKKAYPL